MTTGIMGSVVLRHMKRSPHFLRGAVALPAGQLRLLPGEVVIGTYENPPPWNECRLVFTDAAIIIVDGDQVVRILWDDIVDYETLDPSAPIDGVRLRTRKGREFARIAGSYGQEGKFKDAFNLAMVLRSLLGR
jgi:hypothetical protein